MSKGPSSFRLSQAFDAEDQRELLAPSESSEFVPIALSFQEIEYSIHGKSRFGLKNGVQTKLLHSISGCVMPGETLAVMGPSGAGKTTLLNILAGRPMKSASLSGDICLNGDAIQLKRRPHVFKQFAGYVMQSDCLLGSLTVKETLMFYAHMRLPRRMSTAVKEERVDQVIEELGLKRIEHSRIGTQLSRGISGGERKRVSIAVELITAPALVFADEPTTGLDGYNAMSVVETLVSLAKKKKHTVVFTIHQPRSNIFQMFDKLLLLSQGKVVFFGPCSQIIDYFASVGHSIPLRVNPADFLLDVVTVDSRSTPEKFNEVAQLVEQYAQSEFTSSMKTQIGSIQADESIEESFFHADKGANLLEQFWLLLKRNLLESVRNVSIVWAKLATSFAIALIMGSTFFQLKSSQSDIQDRINALFFVMVHMVLSAYTALPQLIDERLLFNRERSSGAYGTFVYLAANTVSQLPVTILNALCFGTVAYYMVGLQPSISHFAFFMLLLVLVGVVGESLCATVSAAAPSLTVANAVTSGILAVFILFNGFCVRPSNIKIIWKWAYWGSFFQYAFSAAMINEFRGLTFDCPTGYCPDPTGEAVIQSLDLENRDEWTCIYVLLCLTVGSRVINYFALRFLFEEKN